MTTEINTFIAGKLDCFAMPHLIYQDKEKCDRCSHVDSCVPVLQQVSRIAHSMTSPGSYLLELRNSEPALEALVWNFDDRTKVAALTPTLLDALISRGIERRDEEGAEQEKTEAAERQAATLKDEILAKFIAAGRIAPAPALFDPASFATAPTDEPKVLATSAIEAGHQPATLEVGSILPNPAVRTGALVALMPPDLANDGAAITTSKLKAVYRFPVPSTRLYELRTNAELIDQLKHLLNSAFGSSTAIGYRAIRSTFCAIQIEMNLRQQYAPQFRPPTPALPHKNLTPDEVCTSRDRQVIDIHWRAFSYDKPTAPAAKYPGIFNNTPFDFSLAEAFAQAEWTPATKVVDLHLSESMQIEHVSLKGTSAGRAWRVVSLGDVCGPKVRQNGAPQIEAALRDGIAASGSTKSLKHLPSMLTAWMARELVGRGSKPSRIVKMVALMTGEKQRDPSAIQKTLSSVDSYLDSNPSKRKKATVSTS